VEKDSERKVKVCPLNLVIRTVAVMTGVAVEAPYPIQVAPRGFRQGLSEAMERGNICGVISALDLPTSRKTL